MPRRTTGNRGSATSDNPDVPRNSEGGVRSRVARGTRSGKSPKNGNETWKPRDTLFLCKARSLRYNAKEIPYEIIARHLERTNQACRLHGMNTNKEYGIPGVIQGIDRWIDIHEPAIIAEYQAEVRERERALAAERELEQFREERRRAEAAAAAERAAAECAAAERIAAERIAAERIAAERLATERLAAERTTAERGASSIHGEFWSAPRRPTLPDIHRESWSAASRPTLPSFREIVDQINQRVEISRHDSVVFFDGQRHSGGYSESLVYIQHERASLESDAREIRRLSETDILRGA